MTKEPKCIGNDSNTSSRATSLNGSIGILEQRRRAAVSLIVQPKTMRFARSLCPKFSKDSLTSRLEACSELEYFIELFGTLKIEYSAIENYTKFYLSLDQILMTN